MYEKRPPKVNLTVRVDPELKARLKKKNKDISKIVNDALEKADQDQTSLIDATRPITGKIQV